MVLRIRDRVGRLAPPEPSVRGCPDRSTAWRFISYLPFATWQEKRRPNAEPGFLLHPDRVQRSTGAWTIVVTDVATGTQGRALLELGPASFEGPAAQPFQIAVIDD